MNPAGAKANDATEIDERSRRRAVTDDRKQRFGQMRVDEDVERSAAGARRRHRELTSVACLERLGVGTDAHQSWQPVTHGNECLATHEWFRAAAADPAVQLPVVGDHSLVAGMRRGRRLRAHHGRVRARAPRSSVFGEQSEEAVVYSVTPLLRSAAHTLSDVIGMSMLVIPRCESASMTAFTYAAGDPTVADSPTPLAPIGWCGEGVTVSPSSNRGVSQAVGIR